MLKITMLEKIKNDMNYFRFRTNWHSHPWLSKLMCWCGRHDYEFVEANGNTGTLECFYCLHRKNSTPSRS